MLLSQCLNMSHVACDVRTCHIMWHPVMWPSHDHDLVWPYTCFTYIPIIGGGTMGAMGALAPVLLKQWGHCPRSKWECCVLNFTRFWNRELMKEPTTTPVVLVTILYAWCGRGHTVLAARYYGPQYCPKIAASRLSCTNMEKLSKNKLLLTGTQYCPPYLKSSSSTYAYTLVSITFLASLQHF